MKTKPTIAICLSIIIAFVLIQPFPALAQHEFNGPYRGANLDRIAFPIGGMGTGMYCLEGTGAISHVSVRHVMNFFNEPACFATVCVLGDTPEQNTARVIEGPLPNWKYFGKPDSGLGSPGATYGFPRFKECEFLARFPFAMISLKDKSLPLDVQMTGWSPFTPPNADTSSLPVGATEYKFVNKSDKPVKAVFSFSTRNFMNSGGSIGPIDGGFVLHDAVGEGREKKGSFAFFVDGDDTIVDHCWFRGGWWDALTIAWDNIAKGRVINNPSVNASAPGATLAVPFELPAHGEKTIRLLTAWYVPETTIRAGSRVGAGGPAFGNAPSRGTAQGQQRVTGFLGRGFVNTFDPNGDGQRGTLTSDPFTVAKKNIHFLIGGGSHCFAQLLVDGKIMRSASGNESETLNWTTWDVAEFAGREAAFRIVDQETGGWGHINIDHIVFSDEPMTALKTGNGNAIINDKNRVTVFEDFERENYDGWTISDVPPEFELQKDSQGNDNPEFYTPWYATQFGSIGDVAGMWRRDYSVLRKASETFTTAFYDSTLPPVVLEAVAANLTILKSPTVLRQQDGRLWCWEGNQDAFGSCHGTCTHVWNYAQAISHLFPSLERSLRQTEYHESSADGTGRQAFRANLPISPGGNAFDAADGQLGGIMKVYREWQITETNEAWLKEYWPLVKRSLDFMIAQWDPRHTGLLEESHHNTYDINYFGPDGHCGSFYLGALAVAIEMGESLNQDVTLYKELLAKGQTAMVEKLYNGEYFIQIVMKEGLKNNFGRLNPADQSAGYREIASIVNEQGPKYQYGTGCLSDGVLGFWMAKMCGYENDIIDESLVKSHLLSVYQYNMKHDLSEHANPQRPTFAQGDDGGLLLCTWPHGGKPMLPFVYSDEVWTGIEYQVASHLMLLGEPAKGLDIAETLRKRHDGIRRNPFNEYECGHWYARAMASYAMLQGLTGVRYDAITQTLYVDSQVGDFKSFLCTETGFGVVTFANGKAGVDVRNGKIDVKNVVVKNRK
ncbi:MAG: non-lysosomal glucosylceramidase [Planctomycetaceae bacterium]|nr:non-lysosomal glucosylceramidase [Planctomycetaceae bacterium]